MEKKAPSYIPDGYVVESEVDAGALYRITYVNTKTGEKIFYRQQVADGNASVIDTENIDYRYVTIGSQTGIVYQNKDTNIVVFADEKHSYSFLGIIAQNELLKIAESVVS